MDGLTGEQQCGVERLAIGRLYLIETIWADTKSYSEEVRTWAWRQLSALESWTESGEPGEPGEEVYEELVLLTELARLMAHSKCMEG